MDDRTYKLLRGTALALALLWLGWAIYDHVVSKGPGDRAYLAANNMFEDGFYDRALAGYRKALADAPDHLAALRGLANTLVQLQRYEDALVTIERAIELDPGFAGHTAIRGIVYDHLGRHEQAMADYRAALSGDPDLAEGMHWLDRLLYNVQEGPTTIADRLFYLEAQFALPPDRRVLKIPERDRAQRPYEQ